MLSKTIVIKPCDIGIIIRLILLKKNRVGTENLNNLSTYMVEFRFDLSLCTSPFLPGFLEMHSMGKQSPKVLHKNDNRGIKYLNSWQFATNTTK